MQKRHRRTLAAVFEKPTRNAMRWAEIEALLRALGQLEQRAGSRVAVNIGGVVGVFHRPHPKPDVGQKTIRDVRDYLTSAGVGPE
jgi:hypothetical protein